MRFEKWQALGNDYLIIERGELPFELTAARVRLMCAGHVGVCADGVLLLSPPADDGHVAELRIFNPDGSEAELSGNGAREAILYLRRRGWTDREEFAIGTLAGTIRPRITGPETCEVDMGAATVTSRDYPEGPADGRGEITAGGASWRFQHVSIGNPQCAIRAASGDELESLDLPAIGPAIEADARFPNRTNVSWYVPLGDGAIRARIFERGVGETLSSGTGASGAAVAYALEQGGGAQRIRVALDGGELDVEVAADLRVNLTGWARPVFEGRFSDEFEKELHETE
ncbi:MAG TPA: diaminopimelate epimerase [Solirubrobacteraceae bacterium]|jgi:diaminopimelate epimerase|nr:diaminopimelate epimerase [Solirubrobacteraceae bacterium]